MPSIHFIRSTLAIFAATTFTAGAPATAVNPTRIAIQPLAAAGSSPEEAERMSALVAAEASRSGLYQPMERRQASRILVEQGIRNPDACESSECLSEIGRTLGVRKVLWGEVGRFEGAWTLDLRLLDVETGALERRVTRQARVPDAKLVEALVRPALNQLAGQGQVAVAP